MASVHGVLAGHEAGWILIFDNAADLACRVGNWCERRLLARHGAAACEAEAPCPLRVSYFLAKNTSGSLRPCGNMKSFTVSRLSPQAK